MSEPTMGTEFDPEKVERWWADANIPEFGGVVVSSSDYDALLAIHKASLERERELQAENEKLKSLRVHTQEWYASHYAKLHDWARKVLPDPYRNQFFSCVANGTYDGMLDVGTPYMCKAGFMVTPSGYINMGDAKGQVIREQTTRAEVAESQLRELREIVRDARHLLSMEPSPSDIIISAIGRISSERAKTLTAENR